MPFTSGYCDAARADWGVPAAGTVCSERRIGENGWLAGAAMAVFPGGGEIRQHELA